MLNAVRRELPEYIEGYGQVKTFQGANVEQDKPVRRQVVIDKDSVDGNKVLSSLQEAMARCGLTDGMTISFHHHLRNGDHVLNMVLEEAARLGFKNLKIAASSIFPVHAPLVRHMENGVVTGLCTNYISGPVAEAVTHGLLHTPLVMHTHGGRARAIEAGDLSVDVAFLAAPSCDACGNINGVNGPAACGFLGYAIADAHYARRVVAITDNLVEYPNCPVEISQEYVDYVVPVASLGDVQGIISGTTMITRDPVGLRIAQFAAEVIAASGLLKENFSFQTGAGGISLAVAAYVREMMKKQKITGSFASGGITGYLVEMLEEGLFRAVFDVQCFDLLAVESQRRNRRHQGISASFYANPHNKGAVVNNLDVMILGATEIDKDFNVNVTTDSNGVLIGGSGGHSDTAAGAKLSIVVTKLTKVRLPIIRDAVTTITTPGETVDAVVTERGIAVNPRRGDLRQRLEQAGLLVMTIDELQEIAQAMTGKPDSLPPGRDIVAVVEYRDGTVIDVVYKV